MKKYKIEAYRTQGKDIVCDVAKYERLGGDSVGFSCVARTTIRADQLNKLMEKVLP